MLASEVEPGCVGILNVGHGDTKLSFDPANPAERIRAARIVKDMIRRGYALLIAIERDGKKVFTRATDFNEDVCEYVIADFDPIEAAAADAQEETSGGQEQAEVESRSTAATGKGGPARKRVVKRTVKAEDARAVSVAPTAGG
jgi:hypothetical protein